MKQNPDFILSEIAGVPYLLPTGQAIADHKRGIKTNATGVWLWNLLQEERSLEEVLTLSAAHFEISSEELPEFAQDITAFIQQLNSYHIFVDCEATPAPVQKQIQNSRNTALAGNQKDINPDEACIYLLSIGGLGLKLFCPSDAFPPEFSDFTVGELATIHQEIILSPSLPQEKPEGTVLLYNDELNILEQKQHYLLHFPTAKQHLEIHLDKNAYTVHCYSQPPYNADFRYDFFHAIRLVYLYLARQHNMVALHSASILYQEKLWLFSGHSGAGKSTHTNLWKELYDTPVINGDLNLLAIENGTPVVHGIPWCGTSGICDNKTYPLGGIILLKQAKENYIEPLSPDRKCLLVSQRLISPAWTKTLFEGNLSIVDKLADKILIYRLHCTKEPDAAETIKKELDTYLA